MLFSATFPSDIASLASYALNPGYAMVDTVGETAQQTADKVGDDLLHRNCMKMCNRDRAALRCRRHAIDDTKGETAQQTAVSSSC